MEPALRILSTAIGEVGSIGLACLMALHIADRNVPEHELMATVHVESLSTMRRHLNFCSAHEYASMVKPSRAAAALWHITDIGRSIVIRVISLIGLPGASTGTAAATAEPRLITAPDVVVEEKIFFSTPSSSSSDSNQSSGLNQNQIEEEEEESEFKKFLCREYGFTGQKAARVIADPRVTPELIVGWSFEVAEMVRKNFKFRLTPEAYILGCLIRKDGSAPDEPSRRTMNLVGRAIDMYWKQFCALSRAEEEEDTDAT
jgi:hypothetical protein